MPIGLVWLIWFLILLVEFATPPGIVMGALYVIPILLGASQRHSQQAWRFLMICCAATLLNVLLPRSINGSDWPILLDRSLVCLVLIITTVLVMNNQKLQRRRIALEVDLAQAELRNDVITTLAHDLKTPVLGTLATLPMLEGGPVVEAIRKSQNRCLGLINDLLEVFRAEQDGLQPQLQPCDLLACAREVIRVVEPIARQREVTVVLRQPHAQTHSQPFRADPAMIRRLMENLLLNAVHHSPRGQRVWLQLSHNGQGWLLDVRDSGAGFPPEEVPKLFQRFSQTSAGSRGTGLGLYLCRLISEAHGGSISATNSRGGGARVVVQLPDAGG